MWIISVEVLVLKNTGRLENNMLMSYHYYLMLKENGRAECITLNA
jgi:hypothetical protein